MANIPTSCDVVVIGGGPAGSTVSNLLSRQGYDVVLLEKMRHPRHKIGENLIPDFWKYTDLLGVTEAVKADGFVVKGGALVSWYGVHQTMQFSDFGYDRPALHVERDRFDHILLQGAANAGTQVFENVNGKQVNFTADGANAVVEYHQGQLNDHHAGQKGQIACRYVVDASGQNAVIGRQLGVRQIDEEFRYMALWGYYRGHWYIDTKASVQPYAHIQNRPPVTYVTSVDSMDDLGWVWFIPLRDQISVGLVIPREFVRSLHAPDETWQAFFQRQIHTLPVINQLLAEGELIEGSAGMINNYSYKSREFAGPGYFLVGDAAGFVDPIFSVGVVIAMYMGAAAAWSIDECLRKPTRARRTEQLYSHQVRSRLELARSLALPRYQGAVANNALAEEIVRFSQAGTRELINTAAHLTGRSDNYKELHDDFQTIPSQEKLHTVAVDFSRLLAK